MDKNWKTVSDQMPSVKEYVFIETPFCKYPAAVGFWDGYEWRNADGGSIIKNVRFWQKIKLPEKSERKTLLKENGQQVN